MREEGYGAGSVLLSFLLGGVVGAGLALLLAPQSGRETRQKIREMTDDMKSKTTDFYEQTRDKFGSVVDQGKHMYEEKKSLVKTAIDAGKEAYDKEKERLSGNQGA